MTEGGKRSTAVASALTRALDTVERDNRDDATVALARQYARAIDADPDKHLWRLGPRLLEVLVELRMTPKARAAVVKGGADGDGDGGNGGERQQRRANLHALQSDYAGRTAAGEH